MGRASLVGHDGRGRPRALGLADACLDAGYRFADAKRRDGGARP